MDGKQPAADAVAPDGLLDVYDLALALRCSAEDAATLLITGPLRSRALIVPAPRSLDPWGPLRCQGPIDAVIRALREEQIRQRRRVNAHKRRCARCRSARPGRVGR